jgi:hypothetical protein
MFNVRFQRWALLVEQPVDLRCKETKNSSILEISLRSSLAVTVGNSVTRKERGLLRTPSTSTLLRMIYDTIIFGQVLHFVASFHNMIQNPLIASVRPPHHRSDRELDSEVICCIVVYRDASIDLNDVTAVRQNPIKVASHLQLEMSFTPTVKKFSLRLHGSDDVI